MYARRGALIERFTSTASSGGTLTLSNTSTTFHYITGTAAHTIKLPDATTLDAGASNRGGHKFYLANYSTMMVTVTRNDDTVLTLLPPQTETLVQVVDGSTAAGVWRYWKPKVEDTPMRLRASLTPDANINIIASEVLTADGAGLTVPPINTTIPSTASSTHNLSDGSTTGATFSGAAIPTTTVGHFRRVGYTLLSDGTISVLYTASAASLGALANPGTVFDASGLPIGWVDVEAYAANSFKTAGSATNVIENNVGGTARIHRFGAGGGAGGGGGAYSDGNSTALSGGGTIAIGTGFINRLQSFRVASSSGEAVLSSTPFGTTAPFDRTRILLIGTDDDNPVTINSNDAAKGCVGFGISYTLYKFNFIEFMYLQTEDRYVCVGRG